MKIALLGYGKMGKEIEKVALARNHSVSLFIDINNLQELTEDNLKKADVAIDFSIPAGAYENIMKCFKADVPIVCGTTGWLDRLDEIINCCRTEMNTFFYASNYSIGMNLFFDINKRLAKLMNRFDDYEVAIEETHHIHKLDAPSGTAITLAQDIIKELDRKERWALVPEKLQNSVPITAFRKDEVPGTHVITYNSAVDHIRIEHAAHNRKGLALGAVLAAEFIKDKKGYYTMNDLMNTGTDER